MDKNERFPLGVCVFSEPDLNRPHTLSYSGYIHEILQHAGMCYLTIRPEDMEQGLGRVELLITVGETTLSDPVKAALGRWIAAGHAWISLGGICGLSELLGASLATPYQGFGAGLRTLGEGYLKPQGEHPVTEHLPKPLHYFNGLAVAGKGAKVLATGLDAHGRAVDEPLVLENEVGAGRTLVIAPDITGTVVLVQQGRSVTRDGIPAPDGSAPVTDAVLKSGDGGVLDWLFDRDEVPGSPGFKAYLHPVADLWRELLLRSIFYMAEKQKLSVPVLWYWPRNLPAIAHMSHDTDGNEPEKGWKLLDILSRAQINSTWCVILPGYGKEIMGAVKSAGHEYATHYDSMTPGLDWCWEQFDRQHRELVELFGEIPVSNKNHYLRWEGDMEFFDWCLKKGIQLDQSKGASKTGEAGFNFGTCHAYFPVRFNGEKVDVLEMVTGTQDLNVFAPDTLLEPLLDACIRNHGIYHLLFHPAHVMKEPVEQAILRATKTAKARGLEWWTAKQINSWERARREISWSAYDGKGLSVSLRAPKELKDATVLWLKPGGTVKRWGFGFEAVTKNVGAGKSQTF